MAVYRVSDHRKSAQNDDEAIRLCLLAARDDRERTVLFDGEDYLISSAILLPSDTTVIIDGCTIRQRDLTFDNVFRGDNLVLNDADPNGLPLRVDPIRNVRILGKNGAVICGPEQNPVGYHPFFREDQVMVGDFFGWRTLQISLSLCDGFEVSGLRFDQTRCWAMSFDRCRNGHLHDLSIRSRVKNGDGIDLRSGCHRVLVENVRGDCSDDTVACTALSGPLCEDRPGELSRYLYPMEPTRCLPREPEDVCDITDVTVRNIQTAGMHHGVICLAANGCRIRRVLIENVEEVPTDIPDPYREATVKIYTGYGRAAGEDDIADLTVRNVRGLYAETTVYCNTPVRSGVLENVTHPLGHRLRLDFPEGFALR